ncbi:MAG TPA: tripartite tricarboxylate transporter substrate binding protein [Alphaproteobacteria bacterium]
MALVAATPAAGESEFPKRPVKLIAPFAPGGVADVAARLISAVASKNLGGSIIVDNKVGAGGNIGAQIVAAAPADGYSLLFAGLPMITSTLTSKDVGYDLLKDLTPVCGGIAFDSVFVTSKATGIKSIRTLKDRIADGGAFVSYGTAGINTPSHFMSAWLAHLAGGQAEAVHYRGGSGLMTDVASGRLTYAAATLPVALAQRDELTILASLSKERLAQLPDVPSMVDAGMPDYVSADWTVWMAIYAPTNTPRPIIDKLYTAYNAALQTPDLKAALRVYAMDPMVGYTSDRLATFQKEQFVTWKAVLDKLGVVTE